MDLASHLARATSVAFIEAAAVLRSASFIIWISKMDILIENHIGWTQF